MACVLEHNWGWPRKRGDKHMQICVDCGRERESKVHFDGLRCTKTQSGKATYTLAVLIPSELPESAK